MRNRRIGQAPIAFSYGFRLQRTGRVHRAVLISNPKHFAFRTNERGDPMSAKSFGTLFGRLGKRAGMPFTIFPHMLSPRLRYASANAGHHTRALQAWLGHRTSSTRCATPTWRRIGSRISGDSAPRDPTRFRTIQVCPKNLPVCLWQAEGTEA
jgi:hypothetical protein